MESMYNDTQCSISLRGKASELPVIPYIKELYDFLEWNEIESVFGFTDQYCPLYGGRQYKPELSLSFENLQELKDYNIGLRIPLTNHYVTEESYAQSRSFLDTHHYPGNSVIVLQPLLGEWLARDYPLYSIEISVIRDYTPESVDRVLEKYSWADCVVLDMQYSQISAHDRLDKIVNKDKVRMFANARCRLFCDNPICYLAHSQNNVQLGDNTVHVIAELCSRPPLPKNPYTLFDLEPMKAMGFNKYKFIPPDTKTPGKLSADIKNYDQC
tara:strand:+ start:2741 stop:3550 length:810 start_codon:yes stop_codon:yes gene_type:complete